MSLVRLETYLPDNQCAMRTIMYVDGERKEVESIDVVGLEYEGKDLDEVECELDALIGKPHIDKVDGGELVWTEFVADIRYDGDRAILEGVY